MMNIVWDKSVKNKVSKRAYTKGPLGLGWIDLVSFSNSISLYENIIPESKMTAAFTGMIVKKSEQ